MRTISDIIRDCGGSDVVAAAVDSTEWAVQKWPKNGIPERHWATLRRLGADITVEELHLANELARAAALGGEGRPQ